MSHNHPSQPPTNTAHNPHPHTQPPKIRTRQDLHFATTATSQQQPPTSTMPRCRGRSGAPCTKLPASKCNHGRCGGCCHSKECPGHGAGNGGSSRGASRGASGAPRPASRALAVPNKHTQKKKQTRRKPACQHAPRCYRTSEQHWRETHHHGQQCPVAKPRSSRSTSASGSASALLHATHRRALADATRNLQPGEHVRVQTQMQITQQTVRVRQAQSPLDALLNRLSLG